MLHFAGSPLDESSEQLGVALQRIEELQADESPQVAPATGQVWGGTSLAEKWFQIFPGPRRSKIDF